MGDSLTRSTGQQIFLDNIIKMASSSVETKAEVTMVKLLSSLNQILLFHCFMMMMFAALLRTESEADYAPQEGDDDEGFLMDRADAVSSLLPCLAALVIGAVVVSGGRRALLDMQL